MMDTMKKYLTLLLLAVVSVATGAGCSSNDKPVQITSLKLNEKDLELTVGESFRLVATTRPADAEATIRWTSSDEGAPSAAEGSSGGSCNVATVQRAE